MSRPNVNESSQCYATAEYFDTDKEPFTPSSVQYKIDDITDGIDADTVVNVLPYTQIPGPDTSTRIPITAAQNAMTAGRLTETRRVTFAVIAPGGGITHPFADYDLIRTNPL